MSRNFEPCMCGDTHCPTCGPAQGNSRCPICRAWMDDGCEHIANDGSLKPEFVSQADQVEQEDARSWEQYAAEIERDEDNRPAYDRNDYADPKLDPPTE